MKRSFSLLASLTLAISLAAGCAAPSAAETDVPAERELFAMDTVMRLSAYGENGQAAVDAAASEITRLESLLSRTDEDSQISAVNRRELTDDPMVLTIMRTLGLRETCTEVDGEVADLVYFAKEFSRDTDGAFDITIAPVVSAWGFTTGNYQVPEQAKLDELLQTVGSDRIDVLYSHDHIDGQGTRTHPGAVSLDEGQSIDLGGIAKGYASEQVAAIFDTLHVESGLVYLGGNVYAHGVKPDGSPWRIGIQDPARPDDSSAFAAIVDLSDAFAITSGGYQRYFEQDGVRYHHIIDPATGYPAHSGLESVTIIAPANDPTDAEPGSGAMADAFSTALYVMGEERAVDFWRNGGYDFDMVLVTEDGRVVYTDGLTDRLEEAPDSGYTYETVS